MTYERITLDLTLGGATDAAAAAAQGPSPAASNQWNRGDFRIHARDFAQVHWLVRHPLGRDLLVGKLQQCRPDLKVPTYRTPREFEPMLNDMVDELGMREWQEPSGILAQAKAARFLLRCAWNEGAGKPLPDWRSL